MAPQHIAIIMDGNGRWAAARGLPRSAGHRKGAEAVRRAVEAAITHHVPCLTLFAFSSENWSRPADEISGLMSLLRQFLKSELAELHRQNVRLKLIGDQSRFPESLRRMLDKAVETTAENTGLVLTVALGYGGRAEITQAARRLAAAVKAGDIDVADIDESAVSASLETAGIPDPDLLIRTSGEQRISNFLLWQLAYAELYFTDVLWPDFAATHFEQALEAYARRERRYGGLSIPA